MSEQEKRVEIGVEQQMTAEDVASFYSELQSLGIEIWIAGGWGVAALLGEPIRTYSDLDIIVQGKDVATIRSLLASRGYSVVQRDDLTENNFHLRDNAGHEIDFTVINFDEQGNGIYGAPENGEMNPADSFTGEGMINDTHVHCVSPEYALAFRTGYQIREKDRQDVEAIADKFNLDLPEEYK